MANRFFVATIIVLWLSSMSWLVVDRILPSLFAGKPPSVNAYDFGKVVAWRVSWGGAPVGWAASVRIPGIAGTTELHNRIVLKDAPLMELAPAWMRHAVGDVGNMTFDALTRFEFDSLNNFSAFNSRININDVPSVLRIVGRVEESYLNLKIRSGTLSYPTSVYLPDRKSLNEALFPGARLSQLYVGRRWREEVYSPFHSPSEPVADIQAEVVSKDSMEYYGQIVEVLRVEYRGTLGSGIPHNARLQAESWVDQNGNVLRHDVHVGGSKMRFERLTDEASAEIGRDFFERLTRQGADIRLPDQDADDEAGEAIRRPAA